MLLYSKEKLKFTKQNENINSFYPIAFPLKFLYNNFSQLHIVSIFKSTTIYCFGSHIYCLIYNFTGVCP